MIESIINEIETTKNVKFSKELSSRFIGHMTTSDNTFQTNYIHHGFTISILINYVRGTWKKSNWRKSLDDTDFIHWGIHLNHDIDHLELNISKNDWVRRTFLRQPFLNIDCSNANIQRALNKSLKVLNLYQVKYFPYKHEIWSEEHEIKTHCLTHHGHQTTINNLILAFEDIASILAQSKKVL